jgi:hypothetical protein
LLGYTNRNITSIVSNVPSIPEDDMSATTSKVYTPGSRPCNDHALPGNRTKFIGMPCMFLTVTDESLGLDLSTQVSSRPALPVQRPQD